MTKLRLSEGPGGRAGEAESTRRTKGPAQISKPR